MARPRSDIRERLVHAARDRFLQEGVDGASLRAIARDARTNVGMVAYYFPSKDDLFLAVVEETYGKFMDDLSVALAPGRPARERLQALYRRIGRMSADESVVIRLVLREVLVSSGRLQRIAARFLRGHVPLVLGVLRDGVAEGALSDQRPLLVMLMAAMTLGGPVQAVRQQLDRVMPGLDLPAGDAFADLMLDVLLGGIGKR